MPIDVPMLEQLRARWDAIKAELVRDIDSAYGVFVGTTFKAGLFRQYLRDNRIGWPSLPSGELDIKRRCSRP